MKALLGLLGGVPRDEHDWICAQRRQMRQEMEQLQRDNERLRVERDNARAEANSWRFHAKRAKGEWA
jgi:uncharacterized protein (DUF3084 family)